VEPEKANGGRMALSAVVSWPNTAPSRRTTRIRRLNSRVTNRSLSPLDATCEPVTPKLEMELSRKSAETLPQGRCTSADSRKSPPKGAQTCGEKPRDPPGQDLHPAGPGAVPRPPRRRTWPTPPRLGSPDSLAIASAEGGSTLANRTGVLVSQGGRLRPRWPARGREWPGCSAARQPTPGPFRAVAPASAGSRPDQGCRLAGWPR
jgi:hypothetical protein